MTLLGPGGKPISAAPQVQVQVRVIYRAAGAETPQAKSLAYELEGHETRADVMRGLNHLTMAVANELDRLGLFKPPTQPNNEIT